MLANLGAYRFDPPPACTRKIAGASFTRYADDLASPADLNWSERLADFRWRFAESPWKRGSRFTRAIAFHAPAR